MDRDAELRDEASDLLMAVREAVTGALHEGANPTQLAAILVYVATEMSLQLSDTPAEALPVLLEPMAVATKKYAARADAKAEGTEIELRGRPEGTVH